MKYKSFFCRSLLAFGSLGIITAPGQSIENVNASFSGGKATISYDIRGGAADVRYTIEVFGSHNNYSTPLKAVSGDVGKDVASGLGKRLVWDAQAELGTYKGEVVFRLHGTPIFAPLAFKSATQKSVKKGKSAVVEWTGGDASRNVQLAIVQGDKVVQSLPEMKNTGSYTWSVPSDFEKGEYAYKLSTTGQAVNSGAFKVKSKIPVLVYVAPVVVAVAVILLLPDKPPDGGETQDDLPDAPGPK